MIQIYFVSAYLSSFVSKHVSSFYIRPSIYKSILYHVIYFSSLQEEDLDSQQGVIDFSLYLRSKRDINDDASSVGSSSSLANSTHGTTVSNNRHILDI